MLQLLSGRSHKVITGVALVDADSERAEICETTVSFRHIEAQEIAAYWASNEPRDKAGAYGIQGLGAVFVRELQGCYSNVVGLPLGLVSRMLTEAGLPIWAAPTDE